MSTHSDAAENMFLEGYNCSQSVFATCAEDFGLPRETAIKIAQAFGGGIGRTGGVCGALTGALMVIGFHTSAASGADAASKNKAYEIARRVMDEFARRNGSLHCRDLTGCDLLTDDGQQFQEIDAHHTICVKLVRDAVEIIHNALA